ncbi:DUF1624 domain-containing protein [Psychrobium sp. 1_MG-2023]|uniref:DUF1624 domain-containing protein n=1 Tax=Psychrobium sp. 1_MG-2023 TaxID=3062624 RepID=UPI000C331955|nr:heparan-alpha-glucosaminide N-acetyltransferase domain-containing protein [Psychrobium sp. 1_MG-2023]MDP2561922.1 heparan-alpha-glucosaminide N-acetyltransferase domain-containing protein [Psychrobium sp. 1_MG-2023]PKF59665.1 hypothetical protein CW748_00225 [Alteromonadales bacterium alter-6D02]
MKTQNQHHLSNKTKTGSRLASIDALRGLVIVIMLIDHIRDVFFLHVQIGDPVNVLDTDFSHFILRLLSSLCAPIFVLLTGLSAYLYSLHHSRKQLAQFLFSRGLLLVMLEITVISIAWTGTVPPEKLYLQVIWVIGLSMILMSMFIYLPRSALWLIAIVGIAGHNMLDNIILDSQHHLHTLWAIIHQRDWIELTTTLKARTSYPLVPWPSIMVLGFLIGPLIYNSTTNQLNPRRLLQIGGGLLVSFVLLRSLNVYGDSPWFGGDHIGITIMSFFALTKYPPSLLFILFTSGVGCLILAYFDSRTTNYLVRPLTHFGSAPMFFYITHLYMIGISYLVFVISFGKTQGKYFGFDHLGYLWLMFIVLIIPLYFMTRWFGRLKQRRRDIRWLKYF